MPPSWVTPIAGIVGSIALMIIGWREKVSLPRLGVGTFSAKIDTGARSAALHATNIERVEHHVNFVLPLPKRHHHCRL